MTRPCKAAALAATLILGGLTLAGDSGAASVNDERFAKLKALAGQWSEVEGDGSVAVTYRLSGAGSAVVETIGPGAAHEMITVYTMDRGDLVLTHYCAAGNQPRMKAEKAGEPDSIAFKFVGGGNMANDSVGHMHELDVVIIDADHVKASWHFREGGKETEVKVFDLVRKKA